METRDIQETARRLNDAFRELEWRMDWLILDNDAFESSEVRAVAVELRLACMCHTSIVSDALAAIRNPQEPQAVAVRSVWQNMQAVFDELVQLRIQLDRYEVSGRVPDLFRAFCQFERTLVAFFEAEDQLFVEIVSPRTAAR